MIKTIHKLAIVSALAFASSAQAASAPVNWNYTFDLQWVTNSVVFEINPSAPSSQRGRTTVNPNLISWGARTGSDFEFDTSPSHAYARSSIYIDPHLVSPSTPIETNGASVSANAFVHKNDQLLINVDSFSSAKLRLDIILDPADYGYTGPAFAWSQVFNVTFKETPNNTGTALGDADIFAISWDGNFSRTFTYEGYEYTFNYFETSSQFTTLSTTARGWTGGTNVIGFQTLEGTSTPVQFGFNISAVAVPEPETYAMLLAGLGIIGVVARRRRNSIG
jgi:hypothetical protein